MPGRRCSASTLAPVAPAAAISPSSASSASGESVSSGSTGATITPHDRPAPVIRRTRSSGEIGQVTGQDRALRQHRERCAGAGQRGDDAGHQPVTSLHPLVGIGVGTQRDGFTGPAGRRQLPLQHPRDVDLDDDLAVEVGTRIEVEVGVGTPGEAAMSTANTHFQGDREVVPRRPLAVAVPDLPEDVPGPLVVGGDRLGEPPHLPQGEPQVVPRSGGRPVVEAAR